MTTARTRAAEAVRELVQRQTRCMISRDDADRVVEAVLREMGRGRADGQGDLFPTERRQRSAVER